MSEQPRSLKFEEWRDNSMSNNTLRLKIEFEGFTWREARSISDKAVKLAAQLSDELEQNLKGF